MSNLLFDSRYPVDKIVWLKTGEVTTDQWGWFNVDFPHSLGTLLFVKGVWSIDNFATCYPIGTSKRDVGYMVATSSVITTTSNVNFSGSVEDTNKLQYRMWGVIDETANISISETASQSANKLVLDTRKNLPRLRESFFLNANSTYNHNLGRIPYCDIWATYNGNEYFILMNDMFGKIGNLGEFCKITSNQIITAQQVDAGQPVRYYVRLYD